MLVATTVLYVAMAYGERKKAENTVISFSSNAPRFAMAASSPVVSLMPASDIEQAIRDDFSTISEIIRVDISHDNDEMLINIVADDPPKSVRYRIYDKQASLLKAFPEVSLDFNLIPLS